ncbi:ribosome maturation factor RimP [Gordonia rhizosphera]|uniref:Ribosome maturation factor RimP n=1 Tax=Gordonia rhizosphera NBRC 16068 TaxID=1108045 RepID=K6UZB2_9ACTN|nr:ribosome maturation factor RimP [Gordonia rhizosphera]GAB88808.1 ribosome maturation factor RimP [Gordonia rhizosphera NBRC 16068]
MPAITAEQVSDLVQSVVVDRGFDLEDVVVSSSSGRTDVTVVVDRDGGSDLDVLADLSREISDVLDEEPSIADAAYVLEVTSPGVDRPLTLDRHWRRARGRKVTVDLAAVDDSPARRLTGRIGPVEDGRVRLIVNERGRLRSTDVDLAAVTRAIVEVDFSRPSAAELQMCGLGADEIARRRTDD